MHIARTCIAAPLEVVCVFFAVPALLLLIIALGSRCVAVAVHRLHAIAAWFHKSEEEAD